MTTFKELAGVFEKLEKTRSGNEMRNILAVFIKKTKSDEIKYAAYLLMGRVDAKYKHITMNMGDKLVIKSISLLKNASEEEVNEEYGKKGDLGSVAEEYAGEEQKSLSVKKVFEMLKKIAESSGEGSQDEKIKTLASLLKKCSSLEARYIPRIVLGTLRLGVGEKTLLDALSIAHTGTKEKRDILEHGYNVCPDIGLISERVAKKGLSSMKRFRVKIGRPIQSMLAQRTKELDTIKEKIPGKISCEEKYDGQRVQAHYDGDKVVLFSRRLKDVTNQFPDIVEAVKNSVKCDNCVLDGEVVAVDEDKNLMPFQKLMKRRRKYKVEKYAEKIPAEYFVFDIIYINSSSLLSKTYPERHEKVKEAVSFRTKGISEVNQKYCKNLGCVEDFFNKCISRGAEGMIAKSCSKKSVYKPGKRGWLWIKWKKEYKKMADTFDLTVIGAYHGKGKRGGTYGALLCASYNDEEDSFETFCKLGSGFTDKELDELPEKFEEYKINHKPARVKITKDMTPDVWFSPEIVVEVKGAEITKSPAHTTGEGLALRFPRFIKYRKDKSPEQATTIKEINELYNN